MLACATLGATFIPAFAKASDIQRVNENSESGKNFNLVRGEKVVAQLGRAEILMAKSPYNGELDLTRLTGTHRKELRAGGIEFVLPGLTWTVDNSGNDKQVAYRGGAWVTFYLNMDPSPAGDLLS